MLDWLRCMERMAPACALAPAAPSGKPGKAWSMRRSGKVVLGVAIGLLAAAASIALYVDAAHREASPPLPDEVPQQPFYQATRDRFDANPAEGDIAMVGDSLTFRVNWQAAFPACEVVNRGIEWETTRGVLERLDDIEHVGARDIVVLIGTNDLARTFDDEAIALRQRQIIQRLAQGARVHAVSIPLRAQDQTRANARIAMLNRRLSAECAAMPECRFHDLNARIAPDGFLAPRYTVDGLHLTPAGEAQWIALLAPALACDAPSGA